VHRSTIQPSDTMAEAQVWSPQVWEESVQAGWLRPNEPTGGSDEIEAADVGCFRRP
jgi:hypothetical protein